MQGFLKILLAVVCHFMIICKQIAALFVCFACELQRNTNKTNKEFLMKKIMIGILVLVVCAGIAMARNVNEQSKFIQCEDPNCVNCHGIGYTTCTICNGAGRKLCPKCNGAGFYTCRDCNGSGIAKCRNVICTNGKYAVMKAVPAPTENNPDAVKVITEWIQCEICGGTGTRRCPPTIACSTHVDCPTTVACPKGYTKVWWQCRNCGQEHDYKPKKCINCGKR